jgi:hypothetical protein
VTNVAANVPLGSTTPENNNKKIPSGKGGWYTGLSVKRSIIPKPQCSLIGYVGPTPFKDITNILPEGNSAFSFFLLLLT